MQCKDNKFFEYQGLPCVIEYRDDIPHAANLYVPKRGPVNVHLEEVLPYAYPISKTEYDNLLITLSIRGDDDE